MYTIIQFWMNLVIYFWIAETSHVSSPMEPVHYKDCVFEVNRFTVYNILVKLAPIVIGYHLRKACKEKISKWCWGDSCDSITWKPKQCPRLQKKSKNSGSQCWMAWTVISASILVVTDLVLIILVHSLSTHLWKVWKEPKWIWLARRREIWVHSWQKVLLWGP